MSFDSLLRRFLELPGAQAAAFLDPQGEAIATAGDTEILETLGAYESIWMQDIARISRHAEMGELTEVTIDFAGRRLFAAVVGAGYFLLLVFEPGGMTSLARRSLDEARAELAVEIS